ncbi:rab-GTPase-TBC domain-containing protein [Corynascus similis CBS 632.67]
MEPDRDGGETRPTRASQDATSSPGEGVPGPVNSPPTAAEASSKASDHDSLVTVRLSEPPSLHLNTAVPPSTIPTRKSPLPVYDSNDALAETPEEEDDDDSESEIFEPETSASRRRPNLLQELGQANSETTDEEGEENNRPSSSSSSGSERVDWEELQKKEEQELKRQTSNNVRLLPQIYTWPPSSCRPADTSCMQQTTAALLAKLEQENARIATNSRGSKVKMTEKRRSRESRPRPPSMAQLRKMVSGPTPPALRYSKLPPTPMTELEFYLALVKDPKQTAARLPTLLSNKVRKGVPPPLRGVVWQSMAGARDSALEQIFDRLSGESSPYEVVISKDLGRSFPGVDMFRDPEGDGQRMLGRVLKCFSLYDTKIGYCQGLAFLVGPLLMHMPDKQAFCVLVRLMENYDLRQCFVPDLSGLHIRIYQFRELLRQHLPTLSAHLDGLQVEPAYVSQWFLSFYAVTCPLPMLFRIYDVIFAEGASETIMRVALSLMRKNQVRILACTELEDVMHLLLSRGVWDCYNYNADEFVQDFVALANVVTKERMLSLEQGYKEAKINPSANHRGAQAAPSADVTTAASRFLGRLWASSSNPKLTTTIPAAAQPSTPPSNTTLNPGLGTGSRPRSMVRRSTSKQSLSSMEAASSTTSSAASVLSSVSTEATTISRDSAPDDLPREATPLPSKTPPTALSGNVNTSKDGSKYLHSQIEDLLTALSELQRNHALLASQLQREKEEREDDRKTVRSLLDGLRKKADAGDESSDAAPTEPTTVSEVDSTGPTAEQLSNLLDIVEQRFNERAPSPRSSAPETKLQLRDELARAREQLSEERAKSKEYNRKIQELEQEVATVRDQLRDTHAHVRNVHQEKHRLERQIHGLRTRVSDTPPSADSVEWFPKAASGAAGVGLRELKLGRSRSTPSQAAASYGNKRLSSMTMRKQDGGNELLSTKDAHHPASSGQPPLTAPLNENDAIILELVQAKTSEAVARQELEEAKQKLEQFRKAFGLAPGEMPPVQATPSAASTAIGGMIGRLTGSSTMPVGAESFSKLSTPPATNNTSGGGFWGWRR